MKKIMWDLNSQPADNQLAITSIALKSQMWVGHRGKISVFSL